MGESKNAGGRPRDPGNDAAILRAALELLIERGVDGTSIEQVAKRAGVARLTVYRRFANKNELLAQALAAARVSAEPRLADIPDLSVGTLVDSWAQAVTRPGNRQLLARLIGTLPDSPELFQAYWKSYVEPRRKVFAAAIEGEWATGRLPADTDPELFLDMIGGAMFYRLLVNPAELTAASFADYLWSVLRQLGYRPEGT